MMTVLVWPGGVLGALLGATLLMQCASPAAACFGSRLRVGVPADGGAALAAFATGYFVEEKTGIEPEFVDLESSAQQSIAEHSVDLLVVAAEVNPPPGAAEVRPAGAVPGLGPAQFWIHPEVLDDLRFFTVERALKRADLLFSSAAYGAALSSGAPPRKAARQAVLRAE